MKKIVKFEKLEEIDISSINIESDKYDGTDFSRFIETLGYDPVKQYKEGRIALKKRIIKALNESDDFKIEYYEDEYHGNSCILTTFKVKIESEQNFKKRKAEAKKKEKENILKKAKEKAERELKEYERLKAKFENQ